MARGRKPKANAVRRGGLIPTAPVRPETVVYEPPAMPAMVAASDALSEKWALCTSANEQLRPEDAPLLESWCLWAVMADQCARDLDDDPSPELVRKLEKASTMLMRLGDALNLTPVSRQRAGLISAMTRSTQADVVAKARAEFDAMRGTGA